jgi:histidinol dehydrogenase
VHEGQHPPLSTAHADFEAQFQALQHWSAETDAAIETRVAEIIADVRARGDAALLELTARFDGVQAASMAALEIGADELRAAMDSHHAGAAWRPGGGCRARARLPPAPARRLCAQLAVPRCRRHAAGPEGDAAGPRGHLRARWQGRLPEQRADERHSGPGGRRGRDRDGRAHTPGASATPLVLAAAFVAGVHRVFTIGGAQAVAALAYGTASVPRVDKITGPGNAYVASAKRRVFGQVGIDMIAGPSEILVLADGSTPPDWVAMDLFSQAEHDELAQSILLSPDAAYLDAVQEAIDRLLPDMPRRDVIRASLQGRGALIHTRSMEEACAISNRIAPEHLEISAPTRPLGAAAQTRRRHLPGRLHQRKPGRLLRRPQPRAAHSGTARFSSPLGVYDFVKRSSLIEVSAAGARCWGRWRPNWPTAKACRPMRARPRCGCKAGADAAPPSPSACAR